MLIKHAVRLVVGFTLAACLFIPASSASATTTTTPAVIECTNGKCVVIPDDNSPSQPEVKEEKSASEAKSHSANTYSINKITVWCMAISTIIGTIIVGILGIGALCERVQGRV